MAASSSSKHVVLVLAAVACSLASVASATQWMVGDGGGWRAKFNQTGWADGKTFVVGDTLMFMYPKESHTVIQVGKEDFATCNLQGNPIGVWISGNDVVRLERPGRVWFFCSKPNHCLGGMKLAIDVVVPGNGGGAPAPAPAYHFPLPTVPAPAPLFRFPSSPFFGSPPAPAPVSA